MIDMRAEIDSIKSTVEVNMGSRHTGHRLWLYIFNLYATLISLPVVVWLLTKDVPSVSIAVMVSLIIAITFQIDAGWKYLTKWRGKK